jgi:hypothetical protein
MQAQKTALQRVLEEPNRLPTFKDQAQGHRAEQTVDYKESDLQAIPILAPYSPAFKDQARSVRQTLPGHEFTPTIVADAILVLEG